jgi:hypothetical protein
VKVASHARSKAHEAGGDGDGAGAGQQLLDAGKEKAEQHKQQAALQWCALLA